MGAVRRGLYGLLRRARRGHRPVSESEIYAASATATREQQKKISELMLLHKSGRITSDELAHHVYTVLGRGDELG